MARKFNDEYGWVVIDPADTGVIEKLFKRDVREGEEKLMLAVLENAVECFQRNVLARNPREKQLFREAQEWLFEKDSTGIFSFENICETLQLHPNYIRQGLLCWKDAKLKAYAAQCHRSGRPN